MKKVRELPRSDDEFWDGEKYGSTNLKIHTCPIHKSNWMKHEQYVDNGDGTISCGICGWGCYLPGYMRLHDGKICDLRRR